MNDEQGASVQPASAIEQDRDGLGSTLANLIGVLDKYNDVVDNNSSSRHLREISTSVAEDTEEMMEDGRLLRLGIVGQVKAGKSSLLNLLLFDGQEVLPKAATPMTASLTHILKSDRDEVEVEYYSEQDWTEIERHAREYDRIKSQQAKDGGSAGIEPFLEAAHQLVEMASANRLTVRDHLGKTRAVPASTATLNEELGRFVGAGGELTPLVKSVTIRSSAGVPDLDIVDTPGINDPIVSRSRQAAKMLARCDAVLMLSYAGQFMDSVDAEFFKKRIPEEGIRHRLVLGSKFDSALVDVARDHRGRLDQAKEDTERSLLAHARSAVAQLDDGQAEASKVVLMSAMCATLAGKPADAWAPDEQHAFSTLRKAYPDWLDQPENGRVNDATREHLAWLGNRAEVDAGLAEVRRDKARIITEKMTAFLQEKRAQALEELGELAGQLEEQRTAVAQGDVKDIESQQAVIGSLREELEAEVTSVWVRRVERQDDLLDELRHDVRSEIKEAREEIKGAVRTKTKTKKVKKKGLWSGFKRVFDIESGWEKRTYEKQILDRGALEAAIDGFFEDVEDRVAEVVAKMYSRSFAISAEQVLRRAVAEQFSDDLAGRIDMATVRRALREAVWRIAEESQKDLRKRQQLFLESMESNDSSAAGRDQEGEDRGTNKGSRSDSISRLLGGFWIEQGAGSADGGAGSVRNRKDARELVRRVGDLATQWLDSCKEQVDAVAKRAQAELVPATIGEIKSYQERLKREIEKKEFNLQRYGLVLAELARIRAALQKANDWIAEEMKGDRVWH